jgi:hypothetical protein
MVQFGLGLHHAPSWRLAFIKDKFIYIFVNVASIYIILRPFVYVFKLPFNIIEILLNINK